MNGKVRRGWKVNEKWIDWRWFESEVECELMWVDSCLSCFGYKRLRASSLGAFLWTCSWSQFLQVIGRVCFSNLPWRLVGIGAKKAPTFEEATCYSLGLAPQFGSCCEFLLYSPHSQHAAPCNRKIHPGRGLTCYFHNGGFMWFPYVSHTRPVFDWHCTTTWASHLLSSPTWLEVELERWRSHLGISSSNEAEKQITFVNIKLPREPTDSWEPFVKVMEMISLGLEVKREAWPAWHHFATEVPTWHRGVLQLQRKASWRGPWWDIVKSVERNDVQLVFICI